MTEDKPTARANFSALVSDPAHFIAWGFGVGLTPKLPGTAGSLLALLLYALFLHTLPLPAYLLLIAATVLIGIWASHRSERLLGSKDAGVIVIDEMAGMWIALIMIPPAWSWYLTAFVLFRILDILKPWPIRCIDQTVGGGLGIMLDDVVAGVLSLTAMILLTLLLGGAS